MTDVRDIPHAIQWHEGMLLAPQHFQQQDRRNEELLYHHLSIQSPWHWGINTLRIDRVRIMDGLFRVLYLDAVMPDGLVVHHDAETAEVLELDISPYAEEIKKSGISIHLAVFGKRAGSSAESGVLSRYRSVESDSIEDEFVADSRIAIPRLVPRLFLIAADNPPKKYTSFPLAKLSFENDLFMVTDYIPPLLQVRKNSPVWEICDAVSRKIREKAVFLSEKVTSPIAEMKSSMLLESRIQIHQMVSALLPFEALLNAEGVHPFPLFVSLCAIVSNISGLSGGMIPPVLDPYSHTDIKHSFEQMSNFVFRMLDEGVPQTYTTVPFEVENGIFHIHLKSDWMTREIVIGLRGKPAVAERDVISWMMEALIGSTGRMENIREKRILGAERKHVPEAAGIVPPRGLFLFTIDTEPGPGMEKFLDPDEPMQILNTLDPEGSREPSEILLFVKNT